MFRWTDTESWIAVCSFWNSTITIVIAISLRIKTKIMAVKLSEGEFKLELDCLQRWWVSPQTVCQKNGSCFYSDKEREIIDGSLPEMNNLVYFLTDVFRCRWKTITTISQSTASSISKFRLSIVSGMLLFLEFRTEQNDPGEVNFHSAGWTFRPGRERGQPVRFTAEESASYF